ncbi:hypothetical protein ABEB36_009990 [Hypothenemus hampei]|uniref:SET domain-containing protein n=1 Tax=Hypothenemus hampei TaxID=57062 RepID=A0ABD1EI94_HYPHA
MSADGMLMADKLIRSLTEKGTILSTSIRMAKLTTNKERVDLAYDLLAENLLLPHLSVDVKSDVKSQEFREKGNEMFKEKKFREAHEFYTKSLVYANSNIELSLAFANRSAVLFHKKLYVECLHDIKMALQYDYPEHLKPKIQSRETKAKELMVDQFKIEFNTEPPTISEENQNPLIQAASKSIKLEYTEELGRHVIATTDLKPGEIIAIERPFCQILKNEIFSHCHHCLKLCYILKPCPNCTQALFCSDICQTDANLIYHQYECPILYSFVKWDLQHRLLHLRIVISATKKYDDINKYLSEPNAIYRSDSYKEIHNLVSNTAQRSVSDLFDRAIHAACFYHLLKTFTGFFKNTSEQHENTFKELVLYQMQIGPCNFHEITETKTSDRTSDDLVSQQEIGDGAYSFLSMFNHSCCPNVVRYGYGPLTILITLDSIKAGEQCFDNYGYHYAVMPKKERKARLKKQYFFNCSCIACVENYKMYDFLSVIPDRNLTLSDKDTRALINHNLKEAKKIFRKLRGKIEIAGAQKPNANLGELQEGMKQCLFIFETIKTPI